MKSMTRVKKFFALTASMDHGRRRPPGTIRLHLWNPGNKLIIHLGMPENIKFHKESKEWADIECDIVLPDDWYLVDEPDPHGCGYAQR